MLKNNILAAFCGFALLFFILGQFQTTKELDKFSFQPKLNAEFAFSSIAIYDSSKFISSTVNVSATHPINTANIPNDIQLRALNFAQIKAVQYFQPLHPAPQPRASLYPIETAIDLGYEWPDPYSPPVQRGFVSMRDITGGADPLYTDYKLDKYTQNPSPKKQFIERQNLNGVLDQLNMQREDRTLLENALSPHVNPRRKIHSQEVDLETTGIELTIFQHAAEEHLPHFNPTPHRLNALRFAPDPLHLITVTKAGDDFVIEKQKQHLTKHYIRSQNEIEGSLFYTAQRNGVPAKIISQMANVFLYDIDFQRQIHKGDIYEVVYEAYYNDQGQIAYYGDVLFARMSWLSRKEEKSYFFHSMDDSAHTPKWFTEEGWSATRLLMKTPIEGARISSSYGRRRHPVLGYTKMHKGVDFAARTGTPIMAAGHGKIEYAGNAGTFGKYIRIKHNSQFKTIYAHLNGYAKGIKTGATVKQGQIIGYVGSTGRSTGPHLHYEVKKNGLQINPMKLNVATGAKLSGPKKVLFDEKRLWIDRLRELNLPPELQTQIPVPSLKEENTESLLARIDKRFKLPAIF